MKTFIAALDQSGGTTPLTLKNYGIEVDDNTSTEDMMNMIHAMRMRIVNSPSFTNDHIDTAIIFEDSMHRGLSTPLRHKGIKTYLKVDKGTNIDGTMKDFDLDVLKTAKTEYGITGTKMRSVIHTENDVGKILDQQYEYAYEIKRMGYTPIIEPEVAIDNPNKAIIELSLEYLLDRIDLSGMIVKVTLPSSAGRYSNVKAKRIVGLSGGYTLQKSIARLERCPHIDASFSRALLEGLSHDMSDAAFDIKLRQNVYSIYKRKTGSN